MRSAFGVQHVIAKAEIPEHVFTKPEGQRVYQHGGMLHVAHVTHVNAGATQHRLFGVHAYDSETGEQLGRLIEQHPVGTSARHPVSAAIPRVWVNEGPRHVRASMAVVLAHHLGR